MLSWHIHEDRDQTAAVMAGIANRAAGAAGFSDFWPITRCGDRILSSSS
jgi:hypothetical protein